MVDNQSVEFSDESMYQEKTPSLKEIALRHISKISQLSCQEFTGGYWQEKPIKIGGGMVVTKTYHPDVREAYCNAVDFLYDIIFAMADNKFKELKWQENESFSDPKDKLKEKRKLFQQMNLMFERINFFTNIESYDE